MGTQPEPFVFVLMPFSEGFDDVYELGVKEACRAAGAECQRVDEQIFTENIVDQIYNQIIRADVIVADVTGHNPNVFYEIGYAHALKKKVILLTQHVKDTPFDLRHYPHIAYEEKKIAVLKTALERRIKWYVSKPEKPPSRVDPGLQLSIDGVPLEDQPAARMNTAGYVYFNIDIHNPTGQVLEAEHYELALILPGKAKFYTPGTLSSAKLSDERYIYRLSHTHNIFPLGWFTLEVKFDLYLKAYVTTEAVLRISTGVGSKDYTFTLQP